MNVHELCCRFQKSVLSVQPIFLFDEKNSDISDISIPYFVEKSDKINKGLSLKITRLRDSWDEGKLKDLYRSLRHFKSPFSQEDNFKIFITASEYGYNKREVEVEKLEGVSSLWLNTIIDKDNSEHVHITVNKDGLEYEEICENKFNFGAVKVKIFFFTSMVLIILLRGNLPI